MAIASTEPSHQSFHSSPSTPKQQQQKQQESVSSGSSETSSSRPIADAPDINYQSDSSVHSRKDLDIQSPAYLKSEEYRLLFRLPPDEMLVQDFNCALQDSILFQGHMYLFIRHICFYSNIFGFETKKAIPFKELKCVRKAKTAAIFPNAIEIVAGEKKYFFASFLSRDEAYRLIVDGWSQQCSGTDVLLDHQDLKSEIRTEDSGHILPENFKGPEQRSSDLHSINRGEEGDRSEDCKLLSISDDDITILTSPFEALENGAGNAELIVKAEQVSARKSLSWEVEDADAPKVPDFYTKVAESKFPVQVEEFFNLFCSDEAINFIDSFHRKCGDKELRCTSWSKHKEHGYTREVSFQHPIKIYLGAKYGTCHEVQRFRVYSSSHLVIETSQEVSDVPYGDYFSVKGLWVVERDGNETSNSCILRVYINVAFSKKTMWKGKIETSTVEECREAFSVWLNSAHEILKQKNLEKSEEDPLASDTNASGTQCGELGRDESSLKRSHDASNVHQIPVTASIGSPLESSRHQHFITPSSSTRLFRESLARFCVYLKSQNHLTLFLAISFILILLMQLSIIILLSRRPQVHVISQMDHMNMLGSRENNLVEAGAWLEKRFHYLKNEMHMVDARLESMRQEYALLKENFKGLEQLRKA